MKSSGHSKVFLVYARALFDAAKGGSLIDSVADDIVKVRSILEQDSDYLYKILSSPIVNLEEKKIIVSKVFLKRISDLMFNFLILLITKNRFSNIVGVFNAYAALVDDLKGLSRGEINISKLPSSEDQKKIVDSIQGLLNKKVSAEFIENKELIAGFSASIGSYRLEYSFDTHLKEIEKKLIRG
jgi:F-type H+-transporting ATPase subunit delta